MSKTQRWDWAIGLRLEDLNDQHLQSAYKLNWDNLCKFDNCRKNCKRIMCLACFDRSWIENDSPNTSGYDNFEVANCQQKRSEVKSFVGLRNLGATCYVNCLLQLWYHNPALRKAIYEWEKDCNGQSQTNRQVESSHQMAMICDDKKRTEEKDYKEPIKTVIKLPKEDHNNSSSPSKSATRKSSPTARDKDDNNKKSPGVLTTTSPESKTKTTSSTPASTSSPSSSVIQSNSHRPRQSVHTNPIEQLQLIFARMQFTNQKSIDPFNFIESLALNAAEQQDAQEFGNLFMEFLEKSFANQRNSFVSKIIQNQFIGKYSYATICDHCKHSSLSESNFYELDLSIQNLETLHDCLNEFFRPVPLDGKYNCQHCQKAQSAHRKIILKSLPPTLNLQLLRFVYDVQRNVRQKLNSHIIFPEMLDMGNYLKPSSSSSSSSRHERSNGTGHKSNVYILTAVLIHRGSSPHSGHYIAHIRDRITKAWYKFNDESVEKIGDELQVSTDGENISIVESRIDKIKVVDPKTGKVRSFESQSLKSKTAYMLVYQAYDNEARKYPSDHSEDWQLPDHLSTAVAEENSKSDELFHSLQLAKEVDQQIIQARRDQVRNIYKKLACRSPSDEFEFIKKDWLQNWLTNSSTSAKFGPIDNSDLLCIHDKLDFRKIDQVKCVRSEGADLLYKEYGGGPRLQNALCKQCVELEVKLIQLKEKMKEDQKFITSRAKFKLDADYNFEDAYIVGKDSYRDWQALVMAQFKKAYPELKTQKSSQSKPQEKSSATNTANDIAMTPSQTSDDDNDSQNKAPTNSLSIAKSQNNNNNDDSDSDSEDEEAMERFVFNSDILCEHNMLSYDSTGWRIVPKEVWNIFKFYFGNNCRNIITNGLVNGNGNARDIDELDEQHEERPLIEMNANTLMCLHCKAQEAQQQEIGDIQKQKALEQKTRLLDLFHSRKRASWCSMLPEDVYYALDRQFLSKWQKFVRNPCSQEQPKSICHKDNLMCCHQRSLYNFSNSNPVMPDCPFVLITKDELDGLKQFYPIDHVIEFSIDQRLAVEKLKLYKATQKVSPTKKAPPAAAACVSTPINTPVMESGISVIANASAIASSPSSSDRTAPVDLSGKTASSYQSRVQSPLSLLMPSSRSLYTNNSTGGGDGVVSKPKQGSQGNFLQPSARVATNTNGHNQSRTSASEVSEDDDDIDMSDIDWSECVVSKPRYCSECHEMMKQDELRKLLNYDSATIYITKVENVSPSNSANKSNGNNNNSQDDCDENNEPQYGENNGSPSSGSLLLPSSSMPPPATLSPQENNEEDSHPFKRRRKMYLDDEASEFVPPGVSKQAALSPSTSAIASASGQQGSSMSSQAAAAASMLRRTTRRNRNRQQAYTIKPTQTLLELKKEIFSRCQVLPVDQRLFLNDTLLNDNSKTMAELRIIPNCSLKLEVDKPMNDIVDLIEDEPSSRKSSTQPETGFKGSLLLSNSHL